MQITEKNSNCFNPPFNLAVEKCKSEWKLPKCYQIVSILGQGSYGCVVEAIDNRTNQKVAIKRMANLFRNLGDTKRNLRELTLLRKLNHKNIAKLLDVVIEGDLQSFTTLYLVIEYFPSDLKKLFRSPIYLTNAHIALISYNFLIGLKYLKAAGVLHRDIKPANILINEDCDVKICDFGLARAMNEIHEDRWEENSQIVEKSSILVSETYEMQTPQAKQFQQKMDLMFENFGINGKQSTNYQIDEIQTQDNSNIYKFHSVHKGSTEIPQQYDCNAKKQRLFSYDEQEINSQNQRRSNYYKRLEKRGLTRHVITRWYRAPEVILVEKKYNEKVDIWSFGCIFAELQGTIKQNVENFKDRKAIFPGASCYPLSPIKVPPSTEQSEQQQQQKKSTLDELLSRKRTDQLQMIFQIIGTPKVKQIQWIIDKNAQKYIIEKFENYKPVNVCNIYPYSDYNALTILRKSLRFNPKSRASIEKLLANRFFDQFRNQEAEDMSNVEEVEMELEFEEDLSAEILREYFMKELIFYPQYY